MATGGFSKEVENRLKDFFTEILDPKDMAKMIRQVNYALTLCSMRGCETLESELPNIDDNFYWMNKLAEVFDPYFDVE
ncbi:hypothetical protein [Flavobacterium johnsoniae]|jgi:hypothetical protein|uniref:Uncharacterized protein n=2 Tax=Flavobacterium johnsoniae TaxID=986 RepID=A5FK76_FLAJ1|nr:hypothetical protein [Flavobacterium johnsoniae]ABQ04390.1 hypothetical protein Fjoh_1358 [Flavobacterium johnsoniae UW101]OXE97715.1 hypothetical protein B0A63_16410 [Flavobacterium johnsoniae UW101]WQG83816.1 hypothetical protein SR927_11975 [Flavobacterium johnsoniae UW101]SHK21089.1 hypothetical protein SAMN05444146_0784 [Flavobacterium johnsoniae]